MYLSFYGLKLKPFQNNTNPGFFWLGEKQKEALAIFKYALSKMPGILLLTGDVGTGKTTLINVFLNNLGDQFIEVKVLDPDLEDIDFMNYIADSLDFNTKFSSKDTFFDHFSHFLDTSSTLGKKVILVIDECQRLSSHLLGEIIKLANIEKDATKLLKVLLIGQNEFNDLLQKNATRALHELIAINYAIVPLDLKETGEFIRHRLKIAGAKRDIFSPDAISKIHELSAGIPRRINSICDLALLDGFRKELKTINGKLIRECEEDLRPLDIVNTLGNSPSQFDAVDDSKKSRKRSPDSKLKDGATWQGKILGIVFLLMIPVLLITYFTDLKTFFKNPPSLETRDLNQNTESAIHKVSTEDTDIGEIPSIPTITITKEDLKSSYSVNKPAGENISAVGEQHQKDISVDNVLKNADRLSRTGDLPALDPMDTAHVSENSSRTQILPFSADQQDIAQDQAVKKDSAPSYTAGILQSAIKPNQEEAPKIEKDIRFEKELQRPDIPPAEKESTEAPEPFDITGLKENKTQLTELLDEMIEAHGKVTTDIGKIPSIPRITITKEDLKSTYSVNKPAGKNISAVGEQHQKDISVDNMLKNADRLSRTSDLPALAPMDTAHVSENSSSKRILPLSADQQDISQDQAVKKDSAPTYTAGILQSASKPNQEEAPKIEKDIRLEKELQRPNIPPAEKESTEAPEPSDISVLKEYKAQIKELLDEMIEANGKVSIDKMTKKEIQDALPNIAPKSSKAEETQEDVKDPPENIDPGAVIDWILKNRSKSE